MQGPYYYWFLPSLIIHRPPAAYQSDLPDTQLQFSNHSSWSLNRQQKHCTVCLILLEAIFPSDLRFSPRMTRLRPSHSADRINTDISQLLQRFENIMATATVSHQTRIGLTYSESVLMSHSAGRKPQLHGLCRRDLPTGCGVYCAGKLESTEACLLLSGFSILKLYSGRRTLT